MGTVFGVQRLMVLVIIDVRSWISHCRHTFTGPYFLQNQFQLVFNFLRIFAILSFFSSIIVLLTCISILTKLGSFNCDSELDPLTFHWFSEITLVKVILPVSRVSAWVLSTSLSGDGVSSLLDLLFLLFPICARAKGCFADQEIKFMLKFFKLLKIEKRETIIKWGEVYKTLNWIPKRLFPIIAKFESLLSICSGFLKKDKCFLDIIV